MKQKRKSRARSGDRYFENRTVGRTLAMLGAADLVLDIRGGIIAAALGIGGDLVALATDAYLSEVRGCAETLDRARKLLLKAKRPMLAAQAAAGLRRLEMIVAFRSENRMLMQGDMS